MEIADFIKNIEAEFVDLEPGKLKPESVFRDLFEWNSVNALILIAMVNAEYDVELTADDLRQSKTIQDLFDIVKSRYKG
jgi:acyl carrier protein